MRKQIWWTKGNLPMRWTTLCRAAGEYAGSAWKCKGRGTEAIPPGGRTENQIGTAKWTECDAQSRQKRERDRGRWAWRGGAAKIIRRQRTLKRKSQRQCGIPALPLWFASWKIRRACDIMGLTNRELQRGYVYEEKEDYHSSGRA